MHIIIDTGTPLILYGIGICWLSVF